MPDPGWGRSDEGQAGGGSQGGRRESARERITGAGFLCSAQTRCRGAAGVTGDGATGRLRGGIRRGDTLGPAAWTAGR